MLDPHVSNSNIVLFPDGGVVSMKNQRLRTIIVSTAVFHELSCLSFYFLLITSMLKLFSYLISLGTAVAGQNSTFIPHKGVFSPGENSLYVSYANGAGPYDGTAGYLQKVS